MSTTIPDELVTVSAEIPRAVRDAIDEIARRDGDRSRASVIRSALVAFVAVADQNKTAPPGRRGEATDTEE
jgi:metal-responsive CopG/Arc/MetJ family transcriptional regulator